MKIEGKEMQRPNILHQIYQKVNIKDIDAFLFSAILILISFVYMSCGNPLEPVDSEEEERVKSELKDRSFRQFDPSKDAGKRKGVILDFFDSENKIITLWAQKVVGTRRGFPSISSKRRSMPYAHAALIWQRIARLQTHFYRPSGTWRLPCLC